MLSERENRVFASSHYRNVSRRSTTVVVSQLRPSNCARSHAMASHRTVTSNRQRHAHILSSCIIIHMRRLKKEMETHSTDENKQNKMALAGRKRRGWDSGGYECRPGFVSLLPILWVTFHLNAWNFHEIRCVCLFSSINSRCGIKPGRWWRWRNPSMFHTTAVKFVEKFQLCLPPNKN